MLFYRENPYKTAMPARVQELIASLSLAPHPEGGYYREIFRSPRRVAHPDTGGDRSALTGIYFLLAAGEVSRWHRCLSDEIWHHHEGDPLELWTAGDGFGRIERRLLGPPGEGMEPVRVVEAGLWQAARTTGAYTLSGCAVGPGFEFEDFQLLRDLPEAAEELRRRHPEAVNFI